jgi:hypothetical protein
VSGALKLPAAVAALALAALSTTAAHASITVGTPVDVSAAGGTTDVFTPRVRVANNGDAVATWIRIEGSARFVQASFREGGVWSAPQRVSAAGVNARLPRLAISRTTGSAVVTWVRGTELQAAFRPANGTFGAVQTVSAAGEDAGAGLVAMNDAGAAVVAWSVNPPVGPTGTAHTRAAVRPAGGTFGAGVRLSPTSGPSATPTDVAMSPAGGALVSWRVGIGIGAGRRTSFRPPGGSFGTAEQVADSGAGGSGDLAFDSAGNAVMVWASSVIKASFRPAAGGWSTPQTVSQPAAPQACDGSAAQFDVSVPSLALHPDGTAIMVWSRITDECETLRPIKVESSTRPPGGSFAAAQRVATGGDPYVVQDPDHNALTLFQAGNDLVQTSKRPAGGAWAAPVDLIGPFVSIELEDIDMGPTGHGSAVWRRQIGGERRLQSLPLEGGAPFSLAFSNVKGLFALGTGSSVPVRGSRRGGDPDGRLWATVARPSARKLCFGVAVTRIDKPTAIQLRRGAPGKTGPLIARLPRPRRGNPGTASGCVGRLRPATLTKLFASPGGYYIEVRTRRHKRGAVRGQLFAPPS